MPGRRNKKRKLDLLEPRVGDSRVKISAELPQQAATAAPTIVLPVRINKVLEQTPDIAPPQSPVECAVSWELQVMRLTAENRDLQAENQDLKAENWNLMAENQGLENENQDLKNENENLKIENGGWKYKNQNLKVENQGLNNKNQKLKNENQKLKAQNSQKAQMAESDLPSPTTNCIQQSVEHNLR